jgi:hypothetical protein
MVEISKSGSGEGLGWATGRGYSTFWDLEMMNDDKFDSLVSRRGSREGLVASEVGN